MYIHIEVSQTRNIFVISNASLFSESWKLEDRFLSERQLSLQNFTLFEDSIKYGWSVQEV